MNLRAAHLRSLRKLIGLVTQDTQLFDDTVFANIAYGNKGATREEVIEAAKKAHAHDFIIAEAGRLRHAHGRAGRELLRRARSRRSRWRGRSSATRGS